MAVTQERDYYGRRRLHVTSGSSRFFGGGVLRDPYVSGADYYGTAAGVLTSAAGGTIIGGTAVDSAYIAAADGGQIWGAFASSGASVDAVNGGITSGATAGSSGAVAAAVLVDGAGNPLSGRSQGGTAYDPHVLSGGYALTGGAPGLVVKGYRVQGSGGLISGGQFDSGSTAVTGSGGTSISGSYQGVQWVQSGGRGIGGIFTGSGATQMVNGGIASRSTAMNNGFVHISGATGVGLTAMRGGTVTVQGGTYQGVLDNGIGGTPAVGYYHSGKASDNVVSNGGTEIVGFGGTTTSSHINSGGQGTILDGGVAAGVDVNGGTEVVSSGGAITSGSAGNGGYIDLQSGGVGSTLVANTGGTVQADGGTVTGTLSVNGGTGDIINGGSVNNYVLNQGSAFVHSGQANVFTVNGGTGQVYQGGSVNTYAVDGGTGMLNSGGQANSMVAGPDGGVALVQSGASLNTLSAVQNGNGTVLSGASVANAIAGGTANQYYGGSITISGMASSANASYNGVVSVVSGGEAGSLSVNGGTGFVYAGATIDSPPTVTGTGGSLMLESGVGLANAFASNGGTAIVDSGASVQTVTGGSGGFAVANSGATGQNILLSGGQGTVLNGAQFSSMSIQAGGTGTAASGASLDWMTINSGNGTLQSGATIRHLRVQPGGSGVLMPGASAMDITVDSGGWISGATVTNGNSMSVASAGTAVNTFVTDRSADAGANRTSVLSGGSAINTNIAGAGGARGLGGLLTIESGADLRNTSMGYNARLRIRGLQYDGSGTTFVRGGTLHVIENGKEWTTSLQGSYHGKTASDSGFILLDDGQGNTIVVYDQCFLAGTLIRLEHGDVAVESVKRGDTIRVLNNGQEELREVTNVMKRRAFVHTDLPEDMAGWSVIIEKDAFAPDVPSQDLSVTPEHCFYFDGRFVPARMLVNNQTIRYDRTQSEYDFYHVETQPHAVIWANNTLTESYLDTGERRHFENDEDNVAHLTPSRRLTWEDDAAAPLEVGQSFVEPLFKQFQQRAIELGRPEQTAQAEHDMSDDPDLRVQLDNGTVITPTRRVNDRVLFSFPAKQGQQVRLLSRRFKPSESIGPFVDDRRTLGVLVGSIDVWTGGHEDEITEHFTNEELAGWDVREAGPHRWTRGNAVIPLPNYQVADGEMRLLSVQIQAGGPYILSTADTMPEIAAS